MTDKCEHCNGAGFEPGLLTCAFCDSTGLKNGIAAAAHEAITLGTGVMRVSAEGVEHVPLADVLANLKPFRLLPYGTKFRYRGASDVWVRTEHNVIAEWPCRIWSADGSPRSSLCCFCHLYGDEDNPDGMDTLVEVVDQDAELTALREELAKLRERHDTLKCQRNVAQQRLAAAEQRNAAMASTLEECITEMFLALQDHAVRSAMTVIGRTRFLKLVQDYNTKPTESGASE